MTASPISLATVRFFTQSGTLAPLAGGKLYSYAAGTNTPQALYSDATGSSPLSNPVILDSNGQAQVWMGSNAYKFNLLDASNVQQANWPQDNIQSPIALATAAQSAAQAFATAADTVLATTLRAEIPAQTGTFFTTTGTSTAYTLSPTVPILSRVAGQRYNIKFHVASGASPTLSISGLAAAALKQYDASGAKVDTAVVANQISDVEFDGTDYLLLNPPPAPASSVRQVVTSGPIDATTGLPSIFNWAGGPVVGLTLTTQNITASIPLRVTAANGQLDVLGISTTNLSWTLPDNSGCWLYVDVSPGGSLTTGFTTIKPIYQWMGTPSTTIGQHTFNIAEMKMYVGNGTVANKITRVFVGYATTSGGNAQFSPPFAYEGKFIGTLAFPGTSTQVSVGHSIQYVPPSGAVTFTPRRCQIFAVCNISDVYMAGQKIDISSFVGYFSPALDPYALYISTSNVAATIIPATGGAPVAITPAKWSLEVNISRGW